MIDPVLLPLVAARFKALGDPARLAILSTLQGGEKSVTELVRATGRSQPNISQHLGSLVRAGLLARRREANRAYYRVVDRYLARICDAVCESLADQARAERAWVVRLPRTSGKSRRG